MLRDDLATLVDNRNPIAPINCYGTGNAAAGMGAKAFTDDVGAVQVDHDLLRPQTILHVQARTRGAWKMIDPCCPGCSCTRGAKIEGDTISSRRLGRESGCELGRGVARHDEISAIVADAARHQADLAGDVRCRSTNA